MNKSLGLEEDGPPPVHPFSVSGSSDSRPDEATGWALPGLQSVLEPSLRAVGAAAAALDAATMFQQRQQLLLTAWLEELLVTVPRERAVRYESRHRLRNTQERQDEQWVAVPPLHLLNDVVR